MSDNGFRFGDWQINPDSNTLCQGTTTSQVEPKAMDVLRYLCRHPGAVIPPEELLQACWGNAELGDNPIHKAITQLRRALGDSASDPRYIETVRKRGYRAIAPVMAAEDLQEGSWQQGSPFRGLESFQESHASIFFGRLQATAQLRELVLNRTSDGCAMALVLGPSGSGKTSLVRAGLLPRLMASRTGSGEPVALACTLYMDCADLADGNLFQALAAVLLDAEIDGKLVFEGENAEGLGHWLESSDASTIAGRLAEVAGKIKIGVFVDRLEAIFRAPGVTDEIRSRFIAVLEHLASSRAVLVMLACRNDFYPEVIALPALMALKARGGHFDLNPPDGAEIAQMVRMPAKAAGLKFEVDPATGAALDDVLCDAARGSPDTLPLLQYCLNELYRQRSEDGTLRFEVFRQLGGIEGAIAVRAEQVVSGLSAAQAGALPHVLSLIVDVAEEQGAVTARRAAWSALTNSEARELVQALVEARLFVSELSGDVPSFGMAHEALLRRWPKVSEWIDQHRNALQLRTRIAQDADRWFAADKPRDLLIPSGSRIAQACSLLEHETLTISSKEKEYIRDSLARIKRSEQLRKIILIALSTLAVLSALLGFLAKKSQQTAEIHRFEVEGLMGYMLGDFAEKLRPIGRLDLLDDVSQKALSYLSSFEFDNESDVAATQRAKALQVIAEVNVTRGNNDKALKALLVAKSILETQLTYHKNDLNIIKMLGANSFWKGQIHLNKNEWQEAQHFFEEYKNFGEKLVSLAPQSTESSLELSYAYNNLGAVFQKQWQLEKASEAFKESAAIKQRLLDHDPNNNNLAIDLANTLSWLADTQSQMGHLDSAMNLFSQETGLLKPLYAKISKNASYGHRLANALWHQAELKFALGNVKDGHRDLVEACTLLEDIIQQDPTNQKWQLSLYSMQIRLYEQEAEDNPKDVLNKQINLIEKIESLRVADPKQIKLSQLSAMAFYGLGSTYMKIGENLEAEDYFERSVNLLEKLRQTAVNDIHITSRLSSALLAQGELDHQNGNVAGEINRCRQVQQLLGKESDPSTDYRLLSTLVRAFSCTGELKIAAAQKEKLDKMKYNEIRYVKYLSSHPAQKENK